MSEDRVIVRLDKQDHLIIEQYIRGVSSFAQRAYRDYPDYEGDMFLRKRTDLDTLGFVECEFLDPGEEETFMLGAICVFGNLLVHKLGCEWAVMRVRECREFVICHHAFPEPMILSNLHEYVGMCFEDELMDGEWPPGVHSVLVEVFDCAERRIKAFKGMSPADEEIPPWRIPQKDPLGLQCFPPRGDGT